MAILAPSLIEIGIMPVLKDLLRNVETLALCGEESVEIASLGFDSRSVVPGNCTAEALVSHGGFNTLASFQMAMMFGDKKVKCGDQNNADLYKKPMKGTALCLPQTIGSTTGGMVLYTACATGNQPACMLFSKTIDSLAASGAIPSGVPGCPLRAASTCSAASTRTERINSSM